MGTDAAPIILVVDDTPASRYATSRVLRSAGNKVLEAATGQEALTLADHRPDLIVLDINLPDIDGFEVCQILRTRPEHERTPIIHLSATFVDSADRVHGLTLGADGYLTHPVEPTVLVATVMAFVRARKAEERVRQSEEMFRAVFEHALNGIALISDDLRYVRVNEAMARLLNMSADAVAGTSCVERLPAQSRGPAHDLWTRSRETGSGKAQFTVSADAHRRVDLEWAVTRLSGSPLWLAMVTDVTTQQQRFEDRERLLEAEQVARAEAERANRIKDEFLATVSHELRSPLQAIVGGVEVLKLRAAGQPATGSSALDIIDRNARRQIRLVSDLLDIARITSGKLRVVSEPLNAAELLRLAVESAQASAAARSITLALQLDCDDVTVRADPSRLEQVVQNLLTNAIKFTPAGGRIDTTLRCTARDVQIEVKDSGVGIDPTFLPHIFETFRQADARNSRAYGGLGLGLTIVKRLVNLQGGDVKAHSDGLGHGTTLTVTLPRHAATGAGPVGPQAAYALAQDPHRLEGVHILVVDDDEDMRTVLARLLEQSGIRVSQASSAAQALVAIAADPPDLLLSDISMPHEDGNALIRQVRQAERDGRRLPAIALTGLSRMEDQASVLDNGFQRHLTKPVDADSLLAAIFSLLPERT